MKRMWGDNDRKKRGAEGKWGLGYHGIIQKSTRRLKAKKLVDDRKVAKKGKRGKRNRRQPTVNHRDGMIVETGKGDVRN